MSQRGEKTIACRVARRRFPALLAAKAARVVPIRQALGAGERAATERHLETCAGCAAEYRVLALSRAAMDAAAASEPIVPDEDFFKAVRARIHRGQPSMERADESWAALLFVTARQLIPAMALLLLLIIGATFLWRNAPHSQNPPPQDVARKTLPRLYDDPALSTDEALDSLIAIEEKKNGK